MGSPGKNNGKHKHLCLQIIQCDVVFSALVKTNIGMQMSGGLEDDVAFYFGIIFSRFFFCGFLILIHVFLCVNNAWIKETHHIPMVWVWDQKCDWFEGGEADKMCMYCTGRSIIYNLMMMIVYTIELYVL